MTGMMASNGDDMRVVIFGVILGLAIGTGPLWSAVETKPPVSGKRTEWAGLEAFLKARDLESRGKYREAADAYSEAMEQAPDVDEIRIAFGSMLLDLGMPERVLEVLDGREGLDWYGRKILAVALGQMATRDPDLLPRAREALEDVVSERADDPNLELTLAQVLATMGETAEAEDLVAGLRAVMGDSTRLDVFDARLLLELDRPAEAAEAVARCAALEDQPDICRELRIQGLVAAGDSVEAGTELAKWLEPDDLDGRMRAAALFMDGGASDRALIEVRRVLAVQPDSPGARRMEAMLLVDLGRFDEARHRLKGLLKKEPENVDLLLALAWTERSLKNDDAMREALDRAWEVVSGDAGSPRALRVALTAAQLEIERQHPTVGREWLGRIADERAAGPQLPFLLAETYRLGENWTEGAAALARLQPRLGDDARAPARALEVEFRVRGGDRSAVSGLRPLIESDRLGDVLMALQVLQSLDRWNEVLEAADGALERFPDNRDLRFSRAAALERLGRLDDAAAAFEEILDVDPDDFEAANYLGYMWADAGVELDRAAELIAMAVEARPRNFSYLDSMGWVEFRRGRLGEAERWLRRAVELGGSAEGTVVAHLGEVLLTKGETDEARELLQEALDLGVDDPDRVRGLLDGIGD